MIGVHYIYQTTFTRDKAYAVVVLTCKNACLDTVCTLRVRCQTDYKSYCRHCVQYDIWGHFAEVIMKQIR